MTTHTGLLPGGRIYRRSHEGDLVCVGVLKNEVRINDGESIIIGGLRKKSSQKDNERIPFLGELPGIGKLFGTAKWNDDSTEMFIIITPHIIQDLSAQIKKKKIDALKQRPGDHPLYLEKIQEALKEEKKNLFQDSVDLFLDKH